MMAVTKTKATTEAIAADFLSPPFWTASPIISLIIVLIRFAIRIYTNIPLCSGRACKMKTFHI